jgi:XTP/dITP diphosphohydrolase
MAGSQGISIEPLPELKQIPTCDETGVTFEENAIQKALYYGSHTSGWLFAEDSGLEVDALNGEPGVYSARYAGPDATDRANNDLVLQRLAANPDRRGRFVCVIALVHGGSLVNTFKGSVEGEILEEPKGVNGFGYDPIFYYRPFGCSFGEVDAQRKQAVSHRGAALKLLAEFLKPKVS